MRSGRKCDAGAQADEESSLRLGMKQKGDVRMASFSNARASAPHLKAVIDLEHTRGVRAFKDSDRGHHAVAEKSDLLFRVPDHFLRPGYQRNKRDTGWD